MSIPTDYPFNFDPTYGLSVRELLAIEPPEAPANFDAFWQARYSQALNVDPRPQLADSDSHHPDWIVKDIIYSSTDEFQIRGWLLLPRDGVATRGLVVGHGYGGRDQPDFDIPVTETAILFPCFRGLSRSSSAAVPSEAWLHVLHGIEKPETYILGACVEDLWLAVSALLALYPEIDGRIGYCGISFGGGIGALAIPFDPRISRGHLTVPTFANMPLWLSLPTVGSASSVQAYQKLHGSVLDTLSLFDSATAASRIQIPMLMAVALFDPAVAPPCQFSVANAVSPPSLREIVVLDAGHFDYAGQEAQEALLREKVRNFFGTEETQLLT